MGRVATGGPPKPILQTVPLGARIPRSPPFRGIEFMAKTRSVPVLRLVEYGTPARRSEVQAQ